MATRKEYVAHLLKMFELLGNPTELAAKRAEAVMKIETTLAKGSLDAVARRDPAAVYHRLTVQGVDLALTGIRLGEIFARRGSAGHSDVGCIGASVHPCDGIGDRADEFGRY